jgi:malate synthase
MAERVERDGLKVASELADFIEKRALPGTGVEAGAFWAGFSKLLHDFAPRNRALLDRRAALQAQIDDWHRARRGQAHDGDSYKAFLEEIGYLVPEGGDFRIETSKIDPEIATVAGPQLVVPITNARFALNAANARWGSLYDALYGTDAMGSLPPAGGYDRGRGARVVARARVFLDDAFPIAGASHADIRRYRVEKGQLLADDKPLMNPEKFLGYTGIRAGRTRSCCATTGCMWSWSSTGPIPSARATRRFWPMCGWRRRSARSWIARIRSPASMPRTRYWPMATGWA